jgi:fluoroquinolone resistance protein
VPSAHSPPTKVCKSVPGIESQVHYADRVLKEVRLEHGELASSEFYDCLFLRSSFAESVFRLCRFVNCVFRGCDLSLIKVPESGFTSTRFENSKVIGVNWTEAQWPKAGLANPVGFFECAISHSTFIGLNLPSIQIRDCTATDVDFREADLSGADFGGTDLANSIFGHTNLSQADLSRARNYRIDPAQNMLKQARFSLPEAMSLLCSMDIVLVEHD